MENEGARQTVLSDEYLRTHTVGKLKPLSEPIVLVDYDSQWPETFRKEAEKIRSALGQRVLKLEHVGSTSVPYLLAKPIIDIVLVVAESADETKYTRALEKAGYQLRIREPGWYEHRMFHGPENRMNLHVFSEGCPEIDRMLRFRDWLRVNKADRELYARSKRALAQQHWKYTQNYADAKTTVIKEIMARAGQGITPQSQAGELNRFRETDNRITRCSD
ncbi:MAG: GrpB family protein [Bryobacterales bacterium]|nr:GrpB family protein [Bryobacterales bacterium]